LVGQYARAKEESADHLAEEIMEIADEAMNALTSEQVQAARLRVDARKWIASKLKPKKYGERIEHAGEVAHKHFVAELPKEKSIEEWSMAKPKVAHQPGGDDRLLDPL
jgi:hypothetical protein